MKVDAPLSEKEIRDALPAHFRACSITLYGTTDSTNTQAKAQIALGAPHGAMLLAEEQTDGRGRTGKRFYSPKGAGLYMSVILRPENGADAQLLTIKAAVAVCEAVETLTGLFLKIKWVNDLYLDGKKVCGILTESRDGAYVVGIGLNCHAAAFPDELSGLADSLNSIVSRGVLAARIYENLLTPETDVLSAYKNRSLMFGKEIVYEKNGGAFNAVVLDINDKGNLVVKKDTGETEILTSGEVRISGKW